ncbi:MAG: hypothetical protein HY332_16175 [Chloroflexi bacterium]|nr:hypothetical protein [Chloroflexota bacterium]
MAGDTAGEVERLESWQLPGYLQRLEAAGVAEVTWNRERIALAEAKTRARSISPTATVVVDGTMLYIGEPDHSADDAPRISPIQIGPRRR